MQFLYIITRTQNPAVVNEDTNYKNGIAVHEVKSSHMQDPMERGTSNSKRTPPYQYEYYRVFDADAPQL